MSITNGKLFSIALDILKRESKGRAIDPDTVGYYLDWSQRQYFEQEIGKYASTGRIEDTLLPFLLRTTIPVASLVLPSDYRHHVGSTAHFVVAPTTAVPIDRVTYEEWLERTNNTLLTPSYKRPVMYFYKGDAEDVDEYADNVYNIYFDAGGTVLSSITMAYIKDPPACIFDYYIDAEGEIQYLDELESHELASDGSEEYRDGSISGTFVSISRELWWNDNDKLKILELALMKMGVKMENGAVMQYASMLNQTNAVQP